MKHLILLALVAASGATYGSKRQQWATGQQPELEWGRYLVGVSLSFLFAWRLLFARCEKYSSKLDISRSLVTIFTVTV